MIVHPGRVSTLSVRAPKQREFVLYWMQQSQRATDNGALEWAIARANEHGLPVMVFFGLTDHYPGANMRHYDFMIDGLLDIRERLTARGIRFILQARDPAEGAIAWSHRAAVTICDTGYTRLQRAWRARVAAEAASPVERVEDDVVVPVGEASPKAEWGAYTIRRKIHNRLSEYIAPLREETVRVHSVDFAIDEPELSEDKAAILALLGTDRTVAPATGFVGGTRAGQARFDAFLDHGLESYFERRNDPTVEAQSGMSPYLHFGQVRAADLTRQAMAVGGSGAEAFIEEMVVRRELAMNFCRYRDDYDQVTCLPDWARKTLTDHAGDAREYLYTRDEFEDAATHDPYWNAAQIEMARTGKMHGYMRMYWGKKILEWSRTPEDAMATAVYLNDRYELDGRDPNGYAGIAWCLGLHDRPWAERKVFGKVRYMNAKGLRRKFDADAYVRRVMSMHDPADSEQ